VKTDLQHLLQGALKSLEGSLLPQPVDPTWITVDRTRDAQHGDFASNIAMRLAKSVGRNPRELALAIIAALPANELVVKAEVAGAGFINFFIAGDAQAQVVRQVHELGDAFGRNASGADRKILVEFVSSNPTGPLHVGHGRHGAFGASVANLLAANGWQVHRE